MKKELELAKLNPKKNKKNPPRKKFLLFLEIELSSSNIKSYILSKESICYISGNGTLHFSGQTWEIKVHPKKIYCTSGNRSPKKLKFSQKKAVIIFQETETLKKLIFQEMWTLKKVYYISGSEKELSSLKLKKTFYTSGGTFKAWKSNKKLFFSTTNLLLYFTTP